MSAIRGLRYKVKNLFLIEQEVDANLESLRNIRRLAMRLSLIH